jgi:hypothetical protein
MNLNHLLSTSAALILAASAAQAQTAPGGPADHTRSSTGLPSVDSTRPTGADAGYTTLPNGKVTGSTAAADDAVNSPTVMSAEVEGAADLEATGADAGMKAQAKAESASEMGAMASGTAGARVTTNGPIPDTEENRARYGGPQSRAGKMTEPAGN